VRYLAWIITIPIAVVLISFAVTNRDIVTVGLWPLPFVLDLPLYLLVLGALVVGFLFGGVLAWAGGSRHRSLARRRADRIDRLTAEVRRLRARQAEADEQAKRAAEAERVVQSRRAADEAALRDVPALGKPTGRAVAPLETR